MRLHQTKIFFPLKKLSTTIECFSLVSVFPTKWEKIFANDILDKELMYKIY